MWAYTGSCCIWACVSCLTLQLLRDTIDVQPKNCNHCNLGLEGMNSNCSLAGYNMLEEPSIIHRLSCLLHVFINTN